MIIDVILVFTLAAIIIVGYFLIKALPMLKDKTTDAARYDHGPHRGMYLLERRLHETEGPHTVGRNQPFYGADATMAAARDHFAVADAYQDEWHERFPFEPASQPRQGLETATPAVATTAPDIDVVGRPAAASPAVVSSEAPAPVAVHGDLVQQPVTVEREVISETIIVPPAAIDEDEGHTEAA